MRVDYPVAIDSDYTIWRAFANNYWPALYFVDAHGAVRQHHFGEGEIRALGERHATAAGRGRGFDSARDDLVLGRSTRDRGGRRLGQPGSAENYLGYRDRDSPYRRRGGRAACRAGAPAEPQPVGLSGDWTVRTQPRSGRTPPSARIAYGFHSRDVHLVMGPAVAGPPVRFQVRVDGQPPGAAHGIDVDDQGAGNRVRTSGCIS